MPKIFSEKQREQIRKRLLDEGRKIFSEYGIKKTRIEDITRKVGISKGTFYSFFPSKEALYLAALDELEKNSRPVLAEILEDETRNSKEKLRQTLKLQLAAIEENPIVKTLFNPEEIAYLIRNSPSDELYKHISEHNRFFINFLKNLSKKKQLSTDDIESASALLQTIFFLAIHKTEIGPSFIRQMNLLIDIIADGLIVERRK